MMRVTGLAAARGCPVAAAPHFPRFRHAHLSRMRQYFLLAVIRSSIAAAVAGGMMTFFGSDESHT